MPDRIRTKGVTEEEIIAVAKGNQINLTLWLRVRVVDLLELDSSSYTHLDKPPNLSKFLHLSLIRVAVRIKENKCKTQECTENKSIQ